MAGNKSKHLAEGKGRTEIQALVTAWSLSLLGKAGMSPCCNFYQQETILPSDKERNHAQGGGRNSVSQDYLIINLFPEITDPEKEENERQSVLTYQRAPITDSAAVGLGLIPPFYLQICRPLKQQENLFGA